MRKGPMGSSGGWVSLYLAAGFEDAPIRSDSVQTCLTHSKGREDKRTPLRGG